MAGTTGLISLERFDWPPGYPARVNSAQ